LGCAAAVLSVITDGELVYGLEKSQIREQATRQLIELTGLVPVMELPLWAGQFYGAIRASLDAKREMMGNNDFWITAHAKAAGLVLVQQGMRLSTHKGSEDSKLE
jgi:tRNA(fMet)-specific endonuclease VapC